MAARKSTQAVGVVSNTITKALSASSVPKTASAPKAPKAASAPKTAKASKVSEDSAQIELPRLVNKRITLEIVGTSPLIVHAWSEKAKNEMRDKQQKKAKQAKTAKDPVAEWKASKYLDTRGRDCVPVFALRKAIVSAATFSSEKKTHLRGSLFIEGTCKSKDGTDLIPITFKECRMREDMVRVGNFGSRTADMRYRAEYEGWSAKITIEYNAAMLSAEQIVNLVRMAGFSVGICEWRPEKDGHFGRFTIGSEVSA